MERHVFIFYISVVMLITALFVTPIVINYQFEQVVDNVITVQHKQLLQEIADLKGEVYRHTTGVNITNGSK